MNQSKSNVELLSDNSITQIKDDKFGRGGFVNAIAEIIHSQSTKVNEGKDSDYKNVEENLIIGVFGEWGSGKSSILNLLDENLKERKLLTVYFNPWMYNNEDQIILSLFTIIAEKCGLDNPNKEKLINLLDNYYPLISALSSKAGQVVESVKHAIKDKIGENALDYKEKIDKMLIGTATPLTIFIDDVDRLSKYEIHTLFKTLRLIASFKHVIYVVACDSEMVAKSLKENYANGSIEDGRAFLEKIIQVPIKVPEINTDQLLGFSADYIKKTIKIDITNDDIFKSLFIQYFSTPRDVKRFINGFLFTRNYLQGSIMPSRLLILEIIRIKSKFLFAASYNFYKSFRHSNPDFSYRTNMFEYVNKNYPDWLNSEGKINDANKEYLFYYKILNDIFSINPVNIHSINVLNAIDKIDDKSYDSHFYISPRVLSIYMELVSEEEISTE